MTRTMKAGSEAAFQLQVENLADFYGWESFHAPDNRPIKAASGREYVQSVKPGFPDLILSRGVELIIAELKTEQGRLSKEQDAWLGRFRTFASAVDDVVAQLLKVDGVSGVNGIEAMPVFEVHVWRPAMLEEITTRLSRPTVGVPGDELDPLGVCAHCESRDVTEVSRSRFRCDRCGARWYGIRRRLAA